MVFILIRQKVRMPVLSDPTICLIVKNCGYISAERVSESTAKEMVHSHLGGHGNCTRGHVKLVKVRV